jgi:hypothetical protein
MVSRLHAASKPTAGNGPEQKDVRSRNREPADLMELAAFACKWLDHQAGKPW